MKQWSALRTSAPAKLNITLDVLRRRQDGYHELDMLMLRLSLADGVCISPAECTQVVYGGLGAHVLLPLAEKGKDTVSRAIAVYQERAGLSFHIHAHIHKRIPSEAGLGGGSADAAAVLNGLQYIYSALTQEALHEAALEVGADVPYCLHNDPCRAGGIGERLLFLRVPRKPLWFLLLRPTQGISTGALFSSLQFPLQHPDTNAAQQALIRGDSRALGRSLYNALQPAAALLLPEISSYCTRLCNAGALGAAMTGSGSVVFGLFPSKKAAESAAHCFPDVTFLSICHSLPAAHRHAELLF